jgi:hypothetical protein
MNTSEKSKKMSYNNDTKIKPNGHQNQIIKHGKIKTGMAKYWQKQQKKNNIDINNKKNHKKINIKPMN